MKKAEIERLVKARERGNGFHAIDQLGAIEGLSRQPSSVSRRPTLSARSTSTGAWGYGS